MTDYKVAPEMAEKDFERFVDLMGLEFDTSAMDEDDAKGFNDNKDRMVAAISAGSLIIDDDGQPIFTPQRSKDAKAITFYEPTGATLMAMDRKKKSEDVGKLYSSMGDMTKTDAKTFSKMKMADLKVCMAIATLFLA